MSEPTLRGFCSRLLDGRLPNPEQMAARFVAHFGVSPRPSLEELTLLLERGGFGTLSGGPLEGLKGVHASARDGGYNIFFRDDLGDGARRHTALHEAFEIIHETLSDALNPGAPRRMVCPEADRFAAAVLMQPKPFAADAEASGLDVVALQRMYGCSYVSVTLRLAEALRKPPLLTALYERAEPGRPEEWNACAALRAKAVRRTQGFGTPHSPLLHGAGGRMLQRGRPMPAGSLAVRAAETGQPQYGEDGLVAASARPVLWGGRLAKVAVVAVPYADRTALWPRATSGASHPRRHRAACREQAVL